MLFVRPALLAQTPLFVIESPPKTSEYYEGNYTIEGNDIGTWDKHWFLDSDFTLYHGSSVDSPPSRRKTEVGTWRLGNDSIHLNISKPKKPGESELVEKNYGVSIIFCEIKTGFTEKDSQLPLVLALKAVLLTDNMEFNLQDMVDRMNESATEFSQWSSDEFELHGQVREWLNAYLVREKLVYELREYVNGNRR